MSQISGIEIKGTSRDGITIYILDEIAKRRNSVSDQIRVIRNYSDSSDLIGVDIPKNLLDAAHIRSVSSIKQDALIEASTIQPNMERINSLLDQVNNTNNIILIPHNYHYLLDKGYLALSQNGEFLKVNNNEKIYREFGIKDGTKIKEKLLTEELIHFINKQ